MKDPNKIFKDRLREERKRCGVTQQELADWVGITKSAISSYEVGKRMPGLDLIAIIAKHLYVSVDFLLGFTDERYEIVIPNEVELNLRRLNHEGIRKLCEYYRTLCAEEKYLDRNYNRIEAKKNRGRIMFGKYPADKRGGM